MYSGRKKKQKVFVSINLNYHTIESVRKEAFKLGWTSTGPAWETESATVRHMCLKFKSHDRQLPPLPSGVKVRRYA